MSNVTVTTRLDGFEEAAKESGGELIRKAIYELEADIKFAMAEPKHGREYKRKGRVHQASAPGEAPAIDTSLLINSMEPTFPSATKGILSIAAEDAALLEFGTDKIEARPFAAPALQGLIERYA